MRAMRPTLGDVGILRLFAMCHEFQNVRCRRSEKLELRTLLSRVPIPVRESVDDNNVIVAAPGETSGGAPATSTSGATLGQTGSGAAKVNVLLQAYISRLPLRDLRWPPTWSTFDRVRRVFSERSLSCLFEEAGPGCL